LTDLQSKKQKGFSLVEIDLENIDEGFRVKDITAIHPLTGDEIPIFITSYVCADYATGAIMGVPAHDDKDYAFARKHKLPVKKVMATDESNHSYLIESGSLTGL